MKSFLRLTLLFSMLVAAAFALGEWYVRSLPNPSRDKDAYMRAHGGDVRTLILGSSHTFYGLNPAWMGPGTFSLAQVSQTYRYDLFMLEHYRPEHLQAVILPFSYFSLYEDFESQPEKAYLATRYRLYMDCPYHSRLSRYGFELASFETFKEKLKSLWQPSRVSWNSLGWGSNYRLADRPSPWDNGAERAAVNTYADLRLAWTNLYFLTDIVEWCRSRNIRVILLTTPVSASFYAHEQAEQKKMNCFMLDFVLALYPGTEYYDFERDPRFVDADFYDADHLSDRGAFKLSRLLRDILQSPPPETARKLPPDFPLRPYPPRR